MTESEFSDWLSNIAKDLKQGKGTIALVHLDDNHCQTAACGSDLTEAMAPLLATADAMQQSDTNRVLK